MLHNYTSKDVFSAFVFFYRVFSYTQAGKMDAEDAGKKKTCAVVVDVVVGVNKASRTRYRVKRMKAKIITILTTSFQKPPRNLLLKACALGWGTAVN